MNYKNLRNLYTEFVYDSFSYELINNDLVVTYLYEVKPDIRFKHKLIIKDLATKTFASSDKNVINSLVFNIGLVEIASYWKTVCSPLINVKAGQLDGWQKDWWKKLFMNGMMQYYYENKIDFRGGDFLTLESTAPYGNLKKGFVKDHKILIPIGGGKDSSVTLGVVKNSNFKYATLIVEKASPATHQIASMTDSEHLTVHRVLDLDMIIKLNNKGYLNGHVPYSAALYFISLLTAYLYGYSDILFSNENSSNEANNEYLGKEVNHQYSKTFEFEKDFIIYNKNYLTNINLISFLRPLYEIQISKIFSTMPEYFSKIRSCNKGQKEGVWCGACAKCLSTYILLLPFLGINNTDKVFGKNLLSDGDLKGLLYDLIDIRRPKPFECVGTRIELKVALNMGTKLFSQKDTPALLQVFKNSESYDPKLLKIKEKELMASFGANNLSKEYVNLLKAKL